MLDARWIIERLALEPHPSEGGWFVETHRSARRFDDGHSLATAIYFLLTPDTCSAMHRLPTDEVFHFYLGDPVDMLLLHPDGRGARVSLGADLAAGQRPQVVVPGGVWQGSRLAPGGRVALLGTTLAPGFEPGDYEPGEEAALVRGWPAHADAIRERLR